MIPLRRFRSTRGAALIEFALVVPLLTLLVFGLVESGFALRDDGTLDRSVSQAARVGSGEANSRLADYEVVQSLRSSLAALNASSLEKVIVYDATTASSPSATCMGLARPDDLSVVGVAGECNVYSSAQVDADSPASFGAGSLDCAGDWDANWCPISRVRAGPTPDRIGVYVKLSFNKVTSYLPGTVSLAHRAVYQLEPCVAGDPTC